MIKPIIHLDMTSAKWKKAFPSMQEKIEQVATCAFLNAKKPAAFKSRFFEINILLTDDSYIKTLNKNYRNKNKATNVLSFPQIDLKKFQHDSLDIFPPNERIPLGDIALAFQTVNRECLEQDKSLENHILHLIVHGTLHLLGYDHQHLKESTAMEKLECDILSSLGYPDPYQETTTRKIEH
ncbi:MAG: rRNA maturation RNase YbeY [Alphaproteobacteria bacterium]|nr:rRNA maturation RNase YbeY [Alphaproteobacteria bacterium]